MESPHTPRQNPEDDFIQHTGGGNREESGLPIPAGFTEQEEVLIRFLRLNGFKDNPDYLEYVKAKEAELDLIENPHEGKRARILFDIKKALIIGMAGDRETSYELLRDVGIMAQDTNDREIEDMVDDALTLLGL